MKNTWFIQPTLRLLGAAAVVLCLSTSLAAQNGEAAGAAHAAVAEQAYLTPAQDIADIVLAPRHLNVTLRNLSPARSHFLNSESEGLPRLAALAKPHYNLGGLQIDPQANRARRFTTRAAAGLQLIAAADGRTMSIQVPRNANVSSARWSPDGSRVAFFAHFDDATHIYVADAASGRSRRLTQSSVLATLVTNFEWTADGRSIATVLVPVNRPPKPRTNGVPTEPKVRITEEGENRLRTYVSLLETPHEKQLLEYYGTGQLALIDVANRRLRTVGQPAIIESFNFAPDGQHVRVTTLQKPFSFIVPVSRFGTREEIWDVGGTVLAQISERPLRTGIREEPDSTAPPPMRNVAWRPDGKGLGFLQQEPAPARDAEEAEEQGSASRAARKDRVMQWLPPFDSTNLQVVYESNSRLGSVRYSEDAQTLFLTESARGRTHTYAVDLSDPKKKYTITNTRSEDFYENPGSIMTTRDEQGLSVVRMSPDSRYVYLSGTQRFENPLEQAPRPFVDRLEWQTGEKTRIWQSEAEIYERLHAVLDDEFQQVVISRQSPIMVPNSYHLDLTTGELTKLTDNRDYSPQITHAQREVIEVTRPDGIKFWTNVTLPPDHRPGTRLPAMFWFYPREYTDQEAYDRSNRNHNKNRFPSVGTRSMEILTTQGYAVVQPDLPIIGRRGQANNNYVPDLRNSLAAVIDELDRRGLIDRSRLGIGGHSYGAFSTANAMVHTPFFRAGIAGNGNYNRLLTPIGFQAERRILWESRETYLSMSPFLYLEQMTGALLMYHGVEDQNVGTHPINSERMFHALNGLGKTAALYMYPHEDHGPAAEETLLDLWARWSAWLDTHVKGAGALVDRGSISGSMAADGG